MRIAFSILCLFIFLTPVYGQTVTNITATPPIYNTRFTFSPTTETVIVDSEFTVSVFLDTGKNSINTVELNISFPPDKLNVIKPAGPQSLIALWVVPPSYSNTEGKISLNGIIPNGVITQNGLVATMTFKAKTPGVAVIEIAPTSQVLLNDGLGTETQVNSSKAIISIEPKPPGGVKAFSNTHPFQDQWYNNNNPIIAWEKESGVSDFSYILDNKPTTVPDNLPETNDTLAAYENTPDGIWYFHIKAKKSGLWGSPTHFIVHIDTTPPAEFTPRVEYLTAAILPRGLLSFFTTDALSG